MRETRVTIPCGEITLEGSLLAPHDGDLSRGVVVVCHPHPQYGGSMHNNVVLAIAAGLTERGLAALRFNFRGVHGSSGEHGGGEPEQADVLAALDFTAALPDVEPGRVALAGYSFGAAQAAAVAHAGIPALALVSLPLRAAPEPDSPLAAYEHPLLLLAGERDQACTPEALRAVAEQLPGARDVQIVPGADHFWGGYEREISERVGDFFAAHLGEPRPEGSLL